MVLYGGAEADRVLGQATVESARRGAAPGAVPGTVTAGVSAAEPVPVPTR